jgi:hypothetical protein
MKLQEYFLKKAEIEQEFYSDNLTVEQALSSINDMVDKVEELPLSKITISELNRNKRKIMSYHEDRHDDDVIDYDDDDDN